ncbi:NADH-quinone oxidoreductase subunit NuoN [Novispirillum itersonii]|uniref:NADH-quinone oxidoreductase subunit NuoN n=1 Tax=Novispirillum itersonii TaxID=189 RepID=UPI00037C177A|nr:NADH-quinone oxidoreductase subunit NuoN [Novispirillum itersonii]
MTVIANLGAAAPELFLAGAGIVLLMLGVFRKTDATAQVGWLAVAALVAAAGLVLTGSKGPVTLFNGLFITDGFAVFAKLATLGASALTLILSLSWLAQEQVKKFEYSVIVIFATLGMLMMISANNLMSLYLGLELQGLAAYVLAAFKRDNLKSTESGLKYFILGSVASGLLLYGMSLVYGFTGTTSFDKLAEVLSHHPSTGVMVGLVFMLSGMAFKVSAAPFHMWTPDVYEGAPTPVTAFFAIAPKVAAIALFIRLLAGPFSDLVGAWQQVVWLISILSMAIGAFGAINQTNIKRLLAYSSIGHMGYVLVGLTVASPEGVRGALVYLALYVFMNVGAFAVVLSMRQKGRAVEGISDLAGLSRTSPGLAAALTIFMFSMAGIPPLAGFFSKLYVFMAAVKAGMFGLAIIGVLTSVVSAFYYIRVIKIMYFDEPVDSFDRPATANTVILWGTSAVTLLFWLWPAALINSAQTAAQVLFPG